MKKKNKTFGFVCIRFGEFYYDSASRTLHDDDGISSVRKAIAMLEESLSLRSMRLCRLHIVISVIKMCFCYLFVILHIHRR